MKSRFSPPPSIVVGKYLVTDRVLVSELLGDLF